MSYDSNKKWMGIYEKRCSAGQRQIYTHSKSADLRSKEQRQHYEVMDLSPARYEIYSFEYAPETDNKSSQAEPQTGEYKRARVAQSYFYGNSISTPEKSQQ